MMMPEHFPNTPTGNDADWRNARGVLAPYLPNLPPEEVIRRTRDGACLYCGQLWCPGCKQTIAVPAPALRAEDI